MEVKKIKISPEVLKNDIVSETYSGFTFGYYSGMTQILTGGTNGDSLLTDLSIPLFLSQDYMDVGYYSVFDGDISQYNETINFIFSGEPAQEMIICIYNTSNNKANYLQETTYTVSWGDGVTEDVNVFIPEAFCHLYPEIGSETTYTISFSGTNNMGTFVVKKDVTVPWQTAPNYNPYGTVYFTSNNGSWASSPSSQDYIYPFDADNTVSQQVSSNFVDVPFVVSGQTSSRLNELQTWGLFDSFGTLTNYPIGQIIQIDENITGVTNSMSSSYTAYTINSLEYIDFPDGTSIFVCNTSGLTSEMLTASGLTKFEYLINVIDQPIIQSNVFIERGKNSGLENFRRIGEVGSTGVLETYGYGFFNVVPYNTA